MRFILAILLFNSWCVCNTFAHSHNAVANKGIQFIQNKNQWENKILFKADIPYGVVFFEQDRFTFNFAKKEDWPSHPKNHLKAGQAIHTHSYQQIFLNALPQKNVTGSQPLASYHNYFLGNKPEKWASNVPLFENIEYQQIYNGIDLKVYNAGQSIKYDFIVAPLANADQIEIEYKGVQNISITKGGNLKIVTSVNEVQEQAPYAYQIINNFKVTVGCRFELKNGIVKFNLNKYRHDIPLIIDPNLVFCSYTGSTVDNWGTSACYDNAGNLYAAGIVIGLGYPVTSGAFQTIYGGGNAATWNPYYGDISISKFNTTGTALVYSTFLGGTNNEFPNSTITTINDELIVLGRSYSNDYPITNNAYDNTYNGAGDIVVTKFDFTGNNLVGSTYVGGSAEDGVNFSNNENILGSLKRNYGDDARGEVNYDGIGNIYIGSCTFSNDFPTTLFVAQSSFAGGLQDGVVFKLNANLTNLIWSTYLGGSLNDACYSLDLDNSNNSLYVTGGTESFNFPITAGSHHTNYQGGTADGFLVHMNATNSNILQATYLGTSLYDQSYFVKTDNAGFPYVMGQTTGNTYPIKPITPGALLYTNPNSGQFITKYKKTLDSIVISTVVGNGNGSPNVSPTAFTVDICDNVYFAGWGGNFLNAGPGSITGMPIVNAIQTTTDAAVHSDFYIAVLGRNMNNLVTGTYYGGNGSIEHVDGGTSRFDKNGLIYGAICAGCITNDSYLQATTGAWSTTNQSANCNLAAYKIQVGLTNIDITAGAVPDTFGCAPFTVQFTNSTTGGTYIWNFGDGSPNSNLQSPTHTYITVDTFIVTLVAIDSTTCNIKDSISLTVITTLDSVFATCSVPDTAVCPNDIVQFTSTSINAATFSWDFGDGSLPSNAANPSHQYPFLGTYIVTFIASNPATCNKIDTTYITITVGLDHVEDSFTVNSLYGCFPLTVNFSGWLSHPTTTTYHWNFGDGSPLLFNGLNPTHTFAFGVFNVSLIAFDPTTCDQNDTFTVTIHSDSSNTTAIALATSLTGCNPYTAVFLNNSVNSATYVWDFGDNTPTSTAVSPTHTYLNFGFYTVTLIAYDSFTCNNTDTLKFVVFSDTVKVDAKFTATPITGCIPLVVNLTNTSYHATNYIWNFGDGSFSSLANPPAHTYDSVGSYTITLTAIDTSTCNDTSVFTVIVNPYYTEVNANFILADTMECKSLALGITNLSTTGVNYLWNFGDGTNSNLFTPSKTYNTPGTYNITLTVTDNARCKPVAIAQSTVHIFPVPIAQISVDSLILPSDSIFHFGNTTIGGLNYQWFVNGTLAANTAFYNGSWHPLGNYEVCVIAKNAENCADTACLVVNVEVDPIIGVPKAFSPNGDGINDVFRVYQLGAEKIDFRVYNRWGQLLFKTTDINTGWDGTFKGEPQPLEAYAWTVSATFITGEEKKLKGNVTLVR